MLHGFSKYGTGGGAGPVEYFLDAQAYDKEKGAWYKRDPLPEVIEGDPQTMVRMIDALPYVHKYTSGVLSFTEADTERLKALEGTRFEEAIYDITSRFKDMLFAGIREEHRHILIVAQMHLGRLEMHYVTPRCNYEIDRAWNPAPPGKKKFEQMDAFVDVVNVKYGLDDPRDPLRTRVIKLPQWLPDGEKYTREKLHSVFKQAVIDGVIESRTELLELSKKAGFEITRVGSNYISMKPPGHEKAFKFKGEIYDARFTSNTQFGSTKAESAKRKAFLAKPAVAARYKQAVSERRTFVEERFKKILATVRAEEDNQVSQSFGRASLTSFKGLYDRELSTISDVPHANSLHRRDHKLIQSGKGNSRTVRDSDLRGYDEKYTTMHGSGLTLDGATLDKIGTEAATLPKQPNLIPTVAFPSEYSSVPPTPADIGAVNGSMDSGDSEADKIVNKKRSEFGSLNNKLRQIEAANKKNSGGYSPI